MTSSSLPIAGGGRVPFDPYARQLGEGLKEQIEKFKSIEAQNKKYLEQGRIDTNEKILDGFKDGGRSQRREIITVSRVFDNELGLIRDAKLSELIEKAKIITAVTEDPIEKAEILSGFVDSVFGGKNGSKLIKQQQQWINQEIVRRVTNEIPIGRLTENPYGGSCRHRSLLFKVLADEIGLKASLRRGEQRINDDLDGYHAWNILEITKLGRKKQYLVDVMQRPGEVFSSEEVNREKSLKGIAYFDQLGNIPTVYGRDHNPRNPLEHKQFRGKVSDFFNDGPKPPNRLQFMEPIKREETPNPDQQAEE